MNNKISIITITLNSEKTIESTIKSVIKQNYDNLEYIIIDGKSTDKTLDIIKKYKKHISRIISESDEGISDAFNKGIRCATGNIIGIINSDDLLNNNALNLLNHEINKYPDYDVYYGNTIVFDDNNNYICKPDTDLSKLKLAFLINHQSVFIRREAYEKYGIFNNNYKYAMDFDLISRMYFNGAKFKYLDYEYTWFRNGGVSQLQSSKTIEDCKKIALLNGCTKEEIDDYYGKIAKKLEAISIVRKIGLESILRKFIKKQNKSEFDSNWYDK